METLIIYTIALLIIIAIIYISILYVKVIKDKYVFFFTVFLTSIFIGSFVVVFKQSYKIIDATKVNIVAPDGFYYEHYKNALPKSALYSEIGSIFQMSRVNCFEQIRNFDFFLYRIKKEYSVIYDSVCQTLKAYCRENL